VRATGADAVLAACGLLLVLLSIPLLLAQGDSLDAPVATTLVTIATGFCVALSRRRPTAALLGCALAMFAAVLLGSDLEEDNGLLLIPFFLLPFNWAAGVDHRTFVRTAPLVVLLVPLPVVLRDPSAAAGTIAYILLIPVGLGAAAGRLMRWHTQAARRLERQAVELDANREARAAAAVTAERARIAHDLQDLIAREVSIMVDQAHAAERLTARDPGGAERAIAGLEQTGREALVETRRLLGVLRSGNERPALEPQNAIGVAGRLQELSERGAGDQEGAGPQDAAGTAPVARRRAAHLRGIELPEILIAALLMLVGFADTLLAPADELGEHRWPTVAALTLCPLLLLGMRRHAAAALVGVTAIVLLVHVTATDVTLLFTPIVTIVVAAFAAGAYTDASRTYLLGALLPAIVAIVVLTSGSSSETEDLVFPALVFIAAWFVGRLVHGRAQVAERLERQTAQLERERDELARAAAAHERARIARELHDVIAHSVSAMVIQAGAARRVLPRSPVESAAALRNVQDVGREALGELRSTLGFLQPGEAAPAEARSAPALERVGDLVDGARAAGLPVDLRVRGEPGRLPGSSDLAAYRIVQEALTNTLRHAGQAHATVLLDWREDALVIDVRDTGSGRGGDDAAAPSSGHGLAGMRERAALAGGTLEAGPAHGGGFRVRARIPRSAPDAQKPALEEARPA
jgi:signal transduction histidine kinase